MGLPPEAEMLAAMVSCVLKWASAVCMFISFVGINDNTIKRRQKTPSTTLLDAAYVICNIITSSLCAWKALHLKEEMQYENVPSIINTAQFFGLCVFPFALVSAVISSIYTRWRHEESPFLICGSHCLHIVALIMDLFLVTGEPSALRLAANGTWLITSAMCFIIAGFGSILFSALQDTAATNNEKVASSKKSDHMHSVLERLACKAGIRHVWNAAWHSKVTRNNLPILGEAMQCHRMNEALWRLLKTKPRAAPGQGCFCWCALRVVWKDVLGCLGSNLAYYASLIIRVPLLGKLLQAKSATEASMLTVLFVASCSFEYFLGCVEAVYSYVMSSRLKSLAVGAIFTKMTRMSASALSKNPAAYLVSVVAVDCTIIPASSCNSPKIAVGMLCIPFVLYSISAHVGALKTLCCASWQLVPFLVFLPWVKLQTKLWARIMKLRDARLKRMADLLSSIRLVKFYAWEEPFTSFIAEIRHREISQQFIANLLDGFMDTLFSSSSSVMTLILFGTQTWFYTETTLTASLSFPCLYALSLVDPTTTTVVIAMRGFISAAFGVKRIARACTEPDRDTDGEIPDDKDQLKNGSILMKDCSFAWSSPEMPGSEKKDTVLRDVNLSVKPGSLIGVTGFVGSGKTAFLAAIQGDLTTVGGFRQTKVLCLQPTV
ncbi:uncharacterized protein LOC144154934 [Haemaphysalis longicornis]